MSIMSQLKNTEKTNNNKEKLLKASIEKKDILHAET